MSYIKSKDNSEADWKSRKLQPETEYELSNSTFNKIKRAFGLPEIDLFASRTNKQDPKSETIDAFTIS